VGAERRGGEVQCNLRLGKSTSLDKRTENTQQAQIDIVQPSQNATPALPLFAAIQSLTLLEANFK
jgi:hypothetical protein